MAILEEYERIHSLMLSKYNDATTITRESENASLLQDFLFNLKRSFMNESLQLSLLDKAGFNLLQQQLQKTFKQLNKTSKLENILFRPGGTSFERDIAKLQQVAESNLGVEIRKIKDINIGRASANILNTTDTINIAEPLVRLVEDKCSKVVNDMVGKDFSKGLVKKGRQGKIDNMGNNNIQIIYELNNNTTRVWQILAASNFTLKNYASIGIKEGKLKGVTNIRLGNTTPYVAIVGAISSIDPSLSLIRKNKIFYGGIVEGVINNVAKINYHLNHLQFIYDLSGAGQYYDKLGNIGEAEYLIYNDPYSDNIKVESVKVLISQELQTERSPYLRNVTINRVNNGKLTARGRSKLKNLTK